VSDTYFVCATPRTGSTLLCGLLASSGTAGYPESYFRVEDEAAWAAQFDIRPPYDYIEFVHGARQRGSTENGVFGARVMWGTLAEVVGKLCPSFSGSRSDLGVLQSVFGDIRFVYLWRDDVVAQAVSWARAEQTNVWHADRDEHSANVTPVFDRAQIADLVATINDHNSAWVDWFRSVGVEPDRVRYEDLDRDPKSTAHTLLRSLDLATSPTSDLEVRDRRLSDRLNADWIARYEAST